MKDPEVRECLSIDEGNVATVTGGFKMKEGRGGRHIVREALRSQEWIIFRIDQKTGNPDRRQKRQ